MKNPYKKKGDLDTPAKKSVQTAEETPMNKEILMSTKTTKTCGIRRELSGLTVRDAADMAAKEGLTFVQWLDKYGPVPKAPTGYVPANSRGKRWFGNDLTNRHYIITQVWTAATNRRTIDLWTSKDPGETDTHLTPLEAIQLAADLIELAKDAMADGATDTDPIDAQDARNDVEGN